MNALTETLVCPLCGAEMRLAQPTPGVWRQWNRYKCTCGHAEDRKDDGSPVGYAYTMVEAEVVPAS